MDFQRVSSLTMRLERDDQIHSFVPRFNLPDWASRSSMRLAETISETTSCTVSVGLLNSNLISWRSPCAFLQFKQHGHSNESHCPLAFDLRKTIDDVRILCRLVSADRVRFAIRFRCICTGQGLVESKVCSQHLDRHFIDGMSSLLASSKSQTMPVRPCNLFFASFRPCQTSRRKHSNLGSVFTSGNWT